MAVVKLFNTRRIIAKKIGKHSQDIVRRILGGAIPIPRVICVREKMRAIMAAPVVLYPAATLVEYLTEPVCPSEAFCCVALTARRQRQVSQVNWPQRYSLQ